MPETSLKIGDLARRTDTKVVTIRYYERIGLMPTPERGSGNYRAYAPDAVARLRFIRRCRGLGFSLDQVRELLVLSSSTGMPCDDADRLVTDQLGEVEAKIADLQSIARELRRIASLCEGGGTVSQCRVIQAIAPD